MATLSQRAAKDLAELPPKLEAHARALIDRLDAEPAVGKKLLGKLEGLRSVKLGRAHRIIYKVGSGGVVVVTVRNRKDAYK